MALRGWKALWQCMTGKFLLVYKTDVHLAITSLCFKFFGKKGAVSLEKDRHFQVLHEQFPNVQDQVHRLSTYNIL